VRCFQLFQSVWPLLTQVTNIVSYLTSDSGKILSVSEKAQDDEHVLSVANMLQGLGHKNYIILIFTNSPLFFAVRRHELNSSPVSFNTN
jgi:hypothetical protein